jgi:hypothetical protein
MMFVKLLILGPSITTNKELPIHFSPNVNDFLLAFLHFSQLFQISVYKVFKEYTRQTRMVLSVEDVTLITNMVPSLEINFTRIHFIVSTTLLQFTYEINI